MTTRRDLFGNALLYGSLSAFPLIAAPTSTNGKIEESKHTYLVPLYHAVYVFDKGVDNFRLAGLYSLESDALTQLDKLKALDHYKEGHLSAAGVTKVSHSWVEDFIVSTRLGEMKEVLERIEKLMPKAAE